MTAAGRHHQRGVSYLVLLLTMALSGIWHGAGMTFILWGLVHGLYLVINHAWRMWRPAWDKRRYEQVMKPLGLCLTLLAVVTVLVVAILAACYRPLLFATADPEVAAARGVPVRALGIVFAALVGVAAAQGVQIVGALLVMSLLITPAAAAGRVFSSPVTTMLASEVADTWLPTTAVMPSDPLL